MGILSPAYIYSKSSESVQQQILGSINTKDDSKLVMVRNELSKDSAILSATEQYLGGPVYSRVIDGLVGVMGPVTYTSISISLNKSSLSGNPSVGSSSVTAVIQGVAPTRTALLDFENRLESIKKGNTVDLPISELTKSSDIQFSLKLTESIQ